MESLKWLSQEYYDLNGSHIETLDKPPTPLEFSRLVHISRPVVIKGFNIPASRELWTNQYLVQRMEGRQISIAVTPNGRADAITRSPDNGKLYFVEPCVESMTIGEFLSKLSPVPTDDNSTHAGDTGGEQAQEAYYLQSQNGNLYTSDFYGGSSNATQSEFQPLHADVPSEISWCSKAFGKSPDAVNLWIGDSKSVTSIHSDPYENLYTVIRGRKHFTLLPPTESWCLKERTYPHATYTRTSPSLPLKLIPSNPKSIPYVRWSSITDPEFLPPATPAPSAQLDEGLHESSYDASGAHPIRITLEPGETLYLPAGWWHHVKQSSPSEPSSSSSQLSRDSCDITIAVNWWYDMEMRGMSWVALSFLRGGEGRIGEVPPGNSCGSEDGDNEDRCG